MEKSIEKMPFSEAELLEKVQATNLLFCQLNMMNQVSSLDELKKLMMDSHIIDEEVRQIVAKKGHFRYETPISKYPDSFVSSWIIPNWGKIVDIIEADPNRLPF